jgi:hypothetical protein
MMKAKLKLEAQPNAICKGKKLVVVMTVDGLQLMKNNAIISNLVTLPYKALLIIQQFTFVDVITISTFIK